MIRIIIYTGEKNMNKMVKCVRRECAMVCDEGDGDPAPELFR